MKKLIRRLSLTLLALVLLCALLTLTLEFYPLAEPLTQKNNQQQVIIENIQIVDLKNDSILTNQSILIEGNEIVKIIPKDSITLRENHLLIDGKGNYAIPGLWDMHSHLAFQIAPQAIMPLHIANGVTNIRDMQGIVNINAERERWKKEIESNQLLGPRIMAYADGLVGGNYDDEDIDQLVNQSVKNPNTFIKVYSYISPDRFTQLAQKANAKGVDFAGHYPNFIDPVQAAEAGQKSFEHAYLFLYHSFPESEKYRQYSRHRFLETHPNPVVKPNPEENLANLDIAKFDKLVEAMVANETYFCPTHITRRYEAYADDPDFLKDPRLQYIPFLVRIIWEDDAERMQTRLKDDKQFYLDVHEKGLELTKMAYNRESKYLRVQIPMIPILFRVLAYMTNWKNS